MAGLLLPEERGVYLTVMSKSVPALINPDMLVWARESARLTIDEAAHKGSISAEKLAACEAGDEHLTFAQLMKLAGAYKRPC